MSTSSPWASPAALDQPWIGFSSNLPIWASPQAATLSLCPLLSSPLHWHHLVSAMITVAEKAGCRSRSKQPLSMEKRCSRAMPAQPESTLPRPPCPRCVLSSTNGTWKFHLSYFRNLLARHFPDSPFLLAWRVITSLILEAMGRQNAHTIQVLSVYVEQRCLLSWSSHLGLSCDREVNFPVVWTTGFWRRFNTNVYFFTPNIITLPIIP